MRILFSGDVAWNIGRYALAQALPVLKKEWGGFDFVVINCENAAAGKGMTEKIFNECLDWGVDGMTSGNHIWDKNAFYPVLDAETRVLRPANYPPSCPGRGWTVLERSGKRLGLLNLQGQAFMPPIDSPFLCADAALEKLRAEEGETLPVLVDFHAEATSEKLAMGYHLDGRVSAVWGTHTHVQTSDALVLPKGTAYLTDLGMTGPYVSSIGRDLKPVTKRFLTGMPSRFDVAEGPCVLEGAVIEFDPATKKASSIETLRIREPMT